MTVFQRVSDDYDELEVYGFSVDHTYKGKVYTKQIMMPIYNCCGTSEFSTTDSPFTVENWANEQVSLKLSSGSITYYEVSYPLKNYSWTKPTSVRTLDVQTYIIQYVERGQVLNTFLSVKEANKKHEHKGWKPVTWHEVLTKVYGFRVREVFINTKKEPIVWYQVNQSLYKSLQALKDDPTIISHYYSVENGFLEKKLSVQDRIKNVVEVTGLTEEEIQQKMLEG